MEVPQPTDHHKLLTGLVGEWTYEATCEPAPGEPEITMRGRDTVRALGDLWIVVESEGGMPGGGTFTSVMTLGYDPAKGHFVGSWIGSPMAHMFIYEGHLDEQTNELPLNCEGPSMTDPSQMARYQDVIVFVDNDTRLLRSQMIGDDGVEHIFMEARYTRVKKKKPARSGVKKSRASSVRKKLGKKKSAKKKTAKKTARKPAKKKPAKKRVSKKKAKKKSAARKKPTRRKAPSKKASRRRPSRR